MVQPLWRNRFLRKLKTELPYDPAIPLLGIYPEKNWIIKKYTCMPMFTGTLLLQVCYYTNLKIVTGEGNGNPLQYFCLENPMDGGAWWAAVHGVPKSWARLSD